MQEKSCRKPYRESRGECRESTSGAADVPDSEDVPEAAETAENDGASCRPVWLDGADEWSAAVSAVSSEDR